MNSEVTIKGNGGEKEHNGLCVLKLKTNCCCSSYTDQLAFMYMLSPGTESLLKQCNQVSLISHSE